MNEKTIIETDLKLSKVSRVFGPKKTSFDDLSIDEKNLVSKCYIYRFRSHSCCYCRFSAICDNK